MKSFLNIFSSSTRSITIDGKIYNGKEAELRLFVDGVQQGGSFSGNVTVDVHGSCDRVEAMSGDVHIDGDAGSVKTMSGDISCGKVSGSVKSMSGDIRIN